MLTDGTEQVINCLKSTQDFGFVPCDPGGAVSNDQ